MNTSFLCESCGYSLDGAEPDSRCPECGNPIADSLPSARRGSPWQQRPGLFAWAHTVREAYFHPTRLFSQLSMNSVGRGFLILNVFVAAAFIVAPFTGLFIGDWARTARGSGPLLETLASVGSFLVQTTGVAAILFLLTLFDVYGLQLLARTRSWRLPPTAAWAVCCHASAGWLLSGLLPLLFMAWYYILGTRMRIGFRGDITNAGSMRVTWQDALGIGLPIAGYLAGLVAFELLAIKGVKQRRFANTPSVPAVSAAG